MPYWEEPRWSLAIGVKRSWLLRKAWKDRIMHLSFKRFWLMPTQAAEMTQQPVSFYASWKKEGMSVSRHTTSPQLTPFSIERSRLFTTFTGHTIRVISRRCFLNMIRGLAICAVQPVFSTLNLYFLQA